MSNELSEYKFQIIVLAVIGNIKLFHMGERKAYIFINKGKLMLSGPAPRILVSVYNPTMISRSLASPACHITSLRSGRRLYQQYQIFI
jgi:hypothetical protein